MTYTLHQSLGRAGDSQRYYKPRRNIHRVVNALFGKEVQAFPPSAVIVQLKKIPDVSFYQGLISWETMRTKTDAVIIRAGQNVWVDAMFRVNYAAAKMRGMLRGIYWFFDDRVSPSAQLDALVEALGDDLPEMEIWVDWERYYGGGHGGLRNVVAFMEAIERKYPTARVGLYTGYWWFIENSNAVANFFQYQYLKDKPLWLAWYAPADSVRIPAPWTSLLYWQFGTPAEDWGQGSFEIDMNYFNGAISEFYARYKMADEPQPEEPGETMRYTVTLPTSSVALRPDHNTANNPIGYIPAATVLQTDAAPFIAPVQLSNTGGVYQLVGDTWASVSYTFNGVLRNGWVAIIHKGLNICTLTDNQPAPQPAELPNRIGLTLDGTTIKWYVAE